MRKFPTAVAAAAAALAAAGAGPARAAVTKAVYATGVTAPAGALWLKDRTPAGGHLWVADHVAGLCRLDPADAAGVTAALDPDSCLLIGQPGQPAYDPATRTVYLPDLSSHSRGVSRVPFDPASGLLAKAAAGLIPASFPLGPYRPLAVAVDSLGQVYAGFKRTGAVYRLTGPGGAAIDAAVPAAGSSDGGPVASLAAVGRDLYLAEAAAVTVVDLGGDLFPGDAPCGQPCVARDAGFGILGPLSLAYDGRYLYAGDVTTLHRVDPASGTKATYATGFANLSGVAVSQRTVAAATLAVTPRKVFAGDDPTAGAAVGLGRWYRMNRKP